MANALFDNARELFLTGNIDWGTGTGGDVIKACLVDAGLYTVSLSAHSKLSSISSITNAIVGGSAGRSAAFLDKTTTAGAADAADITFSGISGASIEAIVLYRDASGVDANSDLIAYIDTATGLPITPNGGDIIVTWDNGANKIFKL